MRCVSAAPLGTLPVGASRYEGFVPSTLSLVIDAQPASARAAASAANVLLMVVLLVRKTGCYGRSTISTQFGFLPTGSRARGVRRPVPVSIR